MSEQPPASSPRLIIASMLCAAIVVAGLGALKVSQRNDLVRVGYDLSEASNKLRVLGEENRRLRLEKSVLSHPERIERFARQNGMRQPEPGQVRVINPGTPAP